MKIHKYQLIPAVLLVYLAVMSVIAYPDYKKGINSPAYYFGVIGVTLLVIVALFFFMRHRDRLRREREEDLRRNN